MYLRPEVVIDCVAKGEIRAPQNWNYSSKGSNVTEKRDPPSGGGGGNCGTDHYQVVAKIVYPFTVIYNKEKDKNDDYPKTKKNTQINNQHYILYLLQQPSIQDLYQRRLTTELDNMVPSQSIEEEHENVERAIHKSAAETLG